MLLNLLKQLARSLRGGAAEGPPAVARRPGAWHHADLEWLAGRVARVPGDFAEIGVFRGDAFRRVATLALSQGRTAHAFDSFRGMAPPQAEDGNEYPAGMFDIGGPGAFEKLMDDAGVPREAYRLWPGFVPECLRQAPERLRFAFAILDLDHYQPTVEALAWLAPRMSPGGILALDDYLESHTILATRAIKEFLADAPEFDALAQFNQQLILRRR